MNTEGFWGDVMPDEAWGAVLQLSAMGLVLAVCAFGVAIIAVVVWNEWRIFASTRRPAEGESRGSGQESDILGQTDRAGGPGVTGARQTSTAAALGPWTCTSCGTQVPNPSPAGPGLTRYKCGAASWTSTYKFPLPVTQPVVFDWDWPAA